MASIASQEIIQVKKAIVDAKNKGAHSIMKEGILLESTVYNLKKEGYTVETSVRKEKGFGLLKKSYHTYKISWE